MFETDLEHLLLLLSLESKQVLCQRTVYIMLNLYLHKGDMMAVIQSCQRRPDGMASRASINFKDSPWHAEPSH